MLHRVTQRRMSVYIPEGECYFLFCLYCIIDFFSSYTCFLTRFYMPDILIVQRYPVVMSVYLAVMGRVLLQNASFFSSLLNEMGREFNQEVRICMLKFKKKIM